MTTPLVIYGAYGYTGELVARRAVERGLSPVLAGRDSERLVRLARELRCEWRAFPLSDAEAVRRGLEGATAILHCAGPFARTFRPVVEACLEAHVHYLDLTGEIPVFEAVAALGPHAERAGVMLLPGAGFDVAPSDCLLAHVARRLPGATSAVLAIGGPGRVSAGTARTVMARAKPARWRPEGPRPPLRRRFDLGAGPVQAVSIPWADLFTAPISTGIRRIAVYLATPRTSAALLASAALLGPMLERIGAAPLASRLLARGAGPSAEERARSTVLMYAEATDDSGGRAAARARVPDTYATTALVAVEIAERVLRGEVKPGYQTPASAYGPDLVLGLPGVERVDL
jgi:short subunit dehydrogenase-like uncharacterized protein